jgi:hypothetical protein
VLGDCASHITQCGAVLSFLQVTTVPDFTVIDGPKVYPVGFAELFVTFTVTIPLWAPDPEPVWLAPPEQPQMLKPLTPDTIKYMAALRQNRFIDFPPRTPRSVHKIGRRFRSCDFNVDAVRRKV